MLGHAWPDNTMQQTEYGFPKEHMAVMVLFLFLFEMVLSAVNPLGVLATIRLVTGTADTRPSSARSLCSPLDRETRIGWTADAWMACQTQPHLAV